MAVTQHQTGTLSELLVMAEYTKKGYSLFSPVMVERCDFLAEKCGRYVRVQVKTGTPFNNGRELLAFSPKPYSKEDADVVVVYFAEKNTFFYIPVEHVEGMTSIRIRITPYLYNVKNEKALHAGNYTKFLG